MSEVFDAKVNAVCDVARKYGWSGSPSPTYIAITAALKVAREQWEQFAICNPRVAAAAKELARQACAGGDHIDDLCYQIAGRFPVHIVGGKEHAYIPDLISNCCPFWALYLSQAHQSLDLVDKVDLKLNAIREGRPE
jgi:hypothetical protein